MSNNTREHDIEIRAQWAIGQAINLASVKLEKDEVTLPVIKDYAIQLFTTVTQVKGKRVTPELRAKAKEEIEKRL